LPNGVTFTFASKNKMQKFTPAVFVLLFIGLSASAQQPEIFSTADGAIQGYDPVAFFKESKPVVGKKELAYSWSGADWHFSSAENLTLFKADPSKYAPQYGGYCAYGTATGHKAPTQPETWTIVNDKLYFNYNTQVKSRWSENQNELIQKADANWPAVKKQ
jgi:YHS domain-containing protein